MNNLYKKGIVLSIIFLFIGTSVVPSIIADIKNESEMLGESTTQLISSNLNNIFYGTSVNDIGRNKGVAQDVDVLSVVISEDVFILDDGTANLSIKMDVTSQALVELYKESFGLPVDATWIDMEIPLNATRIVEMESEENVSYKEMIEPVREKFYKGISEEQKSLFGFQITDFSNSRIVIGNDPDELKIYVDACAIPYITNLTPFDSGTRWEISSPPSGISSEFIHYQMDLSNVILMSFPGKQIYSKSYITRINLPENANLLNSKEFMGENYLVDLGGNKSFSSRMSCEDNMVIFNEKYMLTESMFSKGKPDINRDFMINYSLPTPFSEGFRLDEFEDFEDPNCKHPIDWDMTFTPIDKYGEILGVDYHAVVNFTFDLEDGYAYISTDKVYLDTKITVGAKVYVELNEGLNCTIPIWNGSLSTTTYNWKGILAVPIIPAVDLNLDVEVSFYAGLNITVTKAESFWIRAGTQWELQLAWPPIRFSRIWDYEYLGGSFNYNYGCHFHAMVKPRFGIGIGAYIAGIIGPRVEPGIYLKAEFDWQLVDSNLDIYWYAALGFDVYVGVGFLCGLLHWNWPNPLVDIPLIEWNSEDEEPGGPSPPDDASPPITNLHLLPTVNNWTGGWTHFWFSAMDNGADASGNVTTFFKVPKSDNCKDWTLFNYTLNWSIEVIGGEGYLWPDEYNVLYYSIDDDCNNESGSNWENLKNESVNVDLKPPVSTIAIGTPSSGNNVTTSTPITLDVTSEEGTGEWMILYNITHNGEWTGWINGSKNTSVVLYFDEIGENCLIWSAVDGVDNWEEERNQIFNVYGYPVADAGGPYFGDANEDIVFDASGSYVPQETIDGYRWDWESDGTWDTDWFSSPTATHSYTNDGTYVATLQVKDNQFTDLTDTDTAIVNIGIIPYIWNVETIASNVGGNSGIDVDSNGYPHISYYMNDWDQSIHELKYAFKDNSGWHHQTIDPDNPDLHWGKWSDITLRSDNDNPYISYTSDPYSGPPSHILKKAQWTGSSWEIYTLDAGDAPYGRDIGLYNSIDLYECGIAAHSLISYTDDDLGQLRLVWCEGEPEIVTTGSGAGSIQWTSIAYSDYYNEPYISFWERDPSGGGALKLATRTPPDWNWNITIIDGSSSAGRYNSIDVDSNGYPCISYPGGIPTSLRYAHWNGLEWNITTADDDTGGGQIYTSLAIDSNDHPHISYRQLSSGDLKYAYWTGSEWRNVTLDSEGKVGKYTSIAIDDDNVHISYYDQTNDALKYAKGTKVDPPYQPTNLWPPEGVQGIGVNVDLSWIGGDPDPEDTVNYHIYLGTSPNPSYYDTIGPYSTEQTNTTYDPGILNYGTHYYWKIITEDNHGKTASGPIWDFRTEYESNNPPNTPNIPFGTTSGSTGTSYIYSTATTDIEGDDIYYWFDWGDGTNSGWIGPYLSGEPGLAPHSWNNTGIYYVKAKAKDRPGLESSWSSSLMVNITLPEISIEWSTFQHDMQRTGFINKTGNISSPSIKWRYTGSDWEFDCSPVIGDIDGDGKLEVVIISDFGVFAFNGNNGTIKWSNLIPCDEFSSGPSLGDVDGDGEIEVVFGPAGPDDNTTYCLDGSTGVIEWMYVIPYELPPTGGSSTALGDVDDDGYIEIVVGTGLGIHCLNGLDGYEKWHYNKTYLYCLSPSICDVDDDSYMEIFCGGIQGGICSLNGFNGSAEWSKWNYQCYFSASSLCDIDGDGDIEVLFGGCQSMPGKDDRWVYDNGVFCFDADTGQEEWRFAHTDSDYNQQYSLAVGDVDGDGNQEVIASSFEHIPNHKVFCLDGSSGNEKWNFSAGDVGWSNPTLGDIDGDGKIEVVLICTNGKCYCLRGENGAEQWNMSLENGAFYAPALGDIDGDGKLEIVLVTTERGRIYCLDNDFGAQPPEAIMNGPYRAAVDEEITFDASESYDHDGYIVGYRWDWTNDEIWDTEWLSNPTTIHTYDTLFSGTVRLEVKDNENLSSINTANVQIDAVPPIVWNKTFDISKEGYSVQQTSDNGYILTGTGNGDLFLLKTDSDGNEQWNKTFDGGSYTDVGRYVQQTNDGGYFVIGYTLGGVYEGFWLIKTDINGNEEWNKIFTEGKYGLSGQQTSDGGYIITGKHSNGFIWLVKTDSNGDMEWNRTYVEVNDYSIGFCVRQTMDGGYIVVGDSGTNACLVKTDSNGNVQWEKTFPFGKGISVRQTSDGGYISTGSNNFLLKTDGNGNEEWNATFGGYEGVSVEPTSDGRYIIGGLYTSSFPSKVWLIQADANGTLLWRKIIEGSNCFHMWRGGADAHQTTDEGYILLTSTYSEIWLIRFDPEIIDISPPKVTNIIDYPDPQEVNGLVNISCNVTDDVLVNKVYLDITYPDNSNCNFSIKQNNTGSIYYCNKTYGQTGTYYYFICASDTSGNKNISSVYNFTVITPPIANFTWYPHYITASDIIEFTDQSSDPDGIIVNWTWEFGDVNISYEQNPTHQYGDNGVYQVNLTVIDNDGLTDTFLRNLTILNEPPDAGFTFSPSVPTSLDIIQFTDESFDYDGFIVNWTWEFGDENISYSQNSTHQYGDNGVYLVNLTVMDDDWESDIAHLAITVPNVLPTANFTWSPMNPSVNDIVQFTDLSNDPDGDIISCFWEFGDGDISIVHNPTHKYANNGTYQVVHTIWDDDGDTDSIWQLITVTNAGPTADFTWTPINPTTQDIIQFTDLSTDRGVVNWSWDFDDGNTSTEQNPSHQYSDDGDYNVCLTVEDDDGANDTICKTVTVTNVGPIANFTWTPQDPTTEDIIQFMDNSSDRSVVNWSWVFGDGNISYEQNPTHQYTLPVSYTVCLTVTDDDGATNSSCKEIIVIGIDINQSTFNRGFPIRHAIDGDWAAAQNFTPTLNTLTSVDIYLRKFGTPEFNLTVELRENHPQGTLLDTVVFTPGEVASSWTWLNVDFNDVAVTPGTDYFIVCPPAPSGVTTSFGYEWGYAFGNQYDNGSFWFTRDGGNWWRALPTMYEFTFRTYGY